MTPTLELEDRLRQGLQAAAGALPSAPDAIPAPGAGATAVGGGAPAARRRWTRTAVATAASLAAVAGAAVVITRAGGAPNTTTMGEAHQVRTTNGMVPGQATADSNGGALRTYGPDGQPTGTVELGLVGVQAAASDLDGGWVACGSAPRGPSEDVEEQLGDTGDGPSSTVASSGQFPGDAWVDRLMWYPAEGAPVALEAEGVSPTCAEGSLQVVDSAGGPMLLVGIGGMGLGNSGPEAGLGGIVLATGEYHEVPYPDLPREISDWSATTGRVMVNVDGVGLRMYDLGDGEELPIAPIDPGSISDLALSHDGKSVAVLVGSIDGPVDVVVYDVATGAETYRRSFNMPSEGDSLSYDGRTLAVGNWYAAEGPLTVIDLVTGAEHTVAAGGVVL